MPRTQKSLDANLKKLNTPSKRRIKPFELDATNPAIISTHPDAPKCPASRKKELFPHESFPIRFQDIRKKPQLNLAWFKDYYDAVKWIQRNNLKPQHYRLLRRSDK